MSDRPENNRTSPGGGGWFTPPNATDPNSLPPQPKTADVPLPGVKPVQSGAWYTPAGTQPPSIPIPPVTAAAPAEVPPAAPPVQPPPQPIQPTQLAQPSQASQPAETPLPQGAALSTEGNYDNYVPGVGFVPPQVTITQPADSEPLEEPLPDDQPVSDLVLPIEVAQPATSQEVAAPPVIPSTPEPAAPAVSLDAIPLPPQPEPIIKSAASKPSEPVPNIGSAAPLPAIPGLGGEPVATTVTPVVTPVQETGSQPVIVQPTSSASPAPLTSEQERAAEVAAVKRPADEPKADVIRKTGPALQIPTAEELQAEPLDQRYSDVEQAVQALRRRYSVGRLTRDQLQAELRKLMIVDNDGHWWMIGLETDRWYKYDGKDWVPSDPAGHRAAASVDSGGRSGGLAKPIINKPSTSQTSETRRYNFPDDDQSLPQRVPYNDPGATVVGRAAARLDPELPGVAPYDGGVTVPSSAVAVTQPGAAVSAPPIEDTEVVPAPLTGQPDYGPKPKGLSNDRQRLSRYLIIAALVLTFVFLIGSLIAVGGAVYYYSSIISQYSAAIDSLPQTVQAASQSVSVYDNVGNVISTQNDPNLGRRNYVAIDNISPDMVAATVAVEDKRFYSTPGFDVIGIVRAVIANLGAGTGVQGGSGITQQLTRALILESGAANDRSTTRKIKEIFVSSEVARRYSKSQILEYYLNTVYYGNLAYGAEAAAQTYFSKPAQQLNLAEAGFLAGLVQAPATYDPLLHFDDSMKRYDDVRTELANLDCIQMENGVYATKPYCLNQGVVNNAAVPIAQVKVRMSQFKLPSNISKYPHFLNYVSQQLEDQFGKDAIYRNGYRVYTTLDTKLQDFAQQAVRDQITKLGNLNIHNGAVLVMKADGEIAAMVGSVDFNSTDPRVAGQVNLTLAARQPGSALKPFIYYTAMERDPNNNSYFTPATVLWDVPAQFNNNGATYTPTNYDGQYHGPQTVRYALANSFNIPAVKTLLTIGLDRFTANAQKFGITFPLTQPNDAGLATALGATEVRLYDLVHAYSVFQNGGKLNTPYAIMKVVHKGTDGNDVVDFDANAAGSVPAPTQVADPNLSYLITNILSDNVARSVEFGLNNPLNIPNTAAKTGTTNNFKDNWVVGYSTAYTVGVWVGNSDGTQMAPGTIGITGAGPIWNAVMSQLVKSQPVGSFPKPPGIAGPVAICADWGTLDFGGCQTKRSDYYYNQNPIAQAGNIFQQVKVDTFTGLLAAPGCDEYAVTQSFVKIDDPTAVNWINSTADGQAFAAKYHLTLPLAGSVPTQQCDPSNPPRPTVKVANPANGSTIFRGPIAINGTVSMQNFQSYELDLATGPNVTTDSAFSKIGGPYGQPQTQYAFLGSWDASTQNPGTYTLRLRVLDTQGHKVDVFSTFTTSDSVTQQQSGDQGGQPFGNPTPTNAPVNGFPTMTPIVISPGNGQPQAGITPTLPLFAPTFTPGP